MAVTDLPAISWDWGSDDTGDVVIKLVVKEEVPHYDGAPDFRCTPQDCYLGVFQKVNPDDPSMFAPAASTVAPGHAVRIEGLRSAPHLNGAIGTAVDMSPRGGRWHVSLRLPGGQTDTKSLREENLVPVVPRPNPLGRGPTIMVSAKEERMRQTQERASEEFLAFTRPRDVFQGAHSAMVIGSTSIVAATVAVYCWPMAMGKAMRAGGVFGMCGMGCLGMCTTTGVLAFGATTAWTQFARGVFATPTAITQSIQGKKWHKPTGKWLDSRCNLAEMENVVLGEDSDSDSDDEAPATTTVKETELYDVLGVAPGATSGEIKKKFYKEALVWHPDKNPGDQAATERFQKINNAYAVLSDPEKRRAYDSQGEAGVGPQMNLNPTVFFSLLFGSERFHEYIGTIRVATELQFAMKAAQRGEQMNMESADGLKNPLSNMRRIQRQQLRRVVGCAKSLKERLHKFVHAREEEAFARESVLEAHSLSQTSFGPQLLTTIGLVYQNRAEHFLGTINGSILGEHWVAPTKWSKGLRGLELTKRSATSALQAFRALLEISRFANEQNPDTLETHEEKVEFSRKMEGKVKEHVPVFVEAVWDFCACDVERNVRDVCRKLLKDMSVPWVVRYRRALALRRLGRIFQDAGLHGNVETVSDGSETMRRIEQMIHASMTQR